MHIDGRYDKEEKYLFYSKDSSDDREITISENISQIEGQKNHNNRPDHVYLQNFPSRTFISDGTRKRRKRLGVELQKASALCADQPKYKDSKERQTMKLAAGKTQKRDTNYKG